MIFKFFCSALLLSSAIHANKLEYIFQNHSRENEKVEIENPKLRIIIKESSYYKCDFEHQDFSEALFVDSRLSYSSFNNARLTGAQFLGVNLRGVSFAGADLRGAIFRRVNLNGTSFTDADLQGVVFENCSLDVFPEEEAANVQPKPPIFARANLSRANIKDCNWQGADLSHAIMENACLSSVNLRQAIIEDLRCMGTCYKIFGGWLIADKKWLLSEITPLNSVLPALPHLRSLSHIPPSPNEQHSIRKTQSDGSAVQVRDVRDNFIDPASKKTEDLKFHTYNPGETAPGWTVYTSHKHR